MAVNLASKYAKQIDQVYTHESYVAPLAGGKYEFTGVKSLKIFAPLTAPLTDYDRDGGYGKPERMQNEVQELIVSQDKGFSLLIDKGDAASANGTFAAGARMKQQIREQVTPMQDKYALAQYAKNAGTVAGVSAPTAEKAVYKLLMGARTAMNNKLVPADGRYCFIGATYAANLIDMGVVVANPQIAGKNYSKGDIGRVLGFKIIEVPDDYLPADCFIVCARSESVVNPHKIHDAKLHHDPIGYSGDVMEGRFLYDAFVLGKKSGGVYAAVLTGSKQANPTIAISGTTATVTSAGATAIKVTTDGSDPRYSDSAVTVQTGGTVTVASGNTVKAVAYGTFTSDVAEKTA